MAAQRSVAPCGQAVQVASAGQMRQGLSKGGFGIYIYIYIDKTKVSQLRKKRHTFLFHAERCQTSIRGWPKGPW